MLVYKPDMQLPTEDALIRHIREFCRTNDVAISAFGLAAVGDSGLMNRLEGGRSPSLRVTRKIYAYMAGYGKTDGE